MTQLFRLLQRCSGWFTSIGTSASAESPARRCTNRIRHQASWPRNSCSAGVTMVSSCGKKLRIEYRLCQLVQETLVGHVPDYLTHLFTPASDVPSRLSLRSIAETWLSRQQDGRSAVAAPRGPLPTDLTLSRSTPASERRPKSFMFARTWRTALWNDSIGLMTIIRSYGRRSGRITNVFLSLSVLSLLDNFSIEISDIKNSLQQDGVGLGPASSHDPCTLTDQSQIV